MSRSGCRKSASTSTSPRSKPATGAGRETRSGDGDGIARGQRDVCPDGLRSADEAAGNRAPGQLTTSSPAFMRTWAAPSVPAVCARGCSITWSPQLSRTGILIICWRWPSRSRFGMRWLTGNWSRTWRKCWNGLRVAHADSPLWRVRLSPQPHQPSVLFQAPALI